MPSIRFVLICATGRSGSTTLMRLLNTIPNSNICGENNMITELLQFYRNMKEACKNKIPGKFKPKSLERCISSKIIPSWYNSFDPTEITSKIRDIIICMFRRNKNDIVIGFKDINYFNRVSLLDEFIELFPNTKIIINIRAKVESQAQSSWWKNDPGSIKYLKDYNQQLIDYHDKNKDKGLCYLSTFENMFDYQKMIDLFKFLGFTIDKKKYDSIMNDNADEWK